MMCVAPGQAPSWRTASLLPSSGTDKPAPHRPFLSNKDARTGSGQTCGLPSPWLPNTRCRWSRSRMASARDLQVTDRPQQCPEELNEERFEKSTRGVRGGSCARFINAWVPAPADSRRDSNFCSLSAIEDESTSSSAGVSY